MAEKRIALVSPTLKGGGAERVAVTLANSFSNSLYSVDVVLIRAEGQYLKELNESVRVINLNAKRTLFAFVPMIRYFLKFKPDSVLSMQGPMNALVISIKKLFRFPFKLVVREAITHSISAQEEKSFKSQMVHYIIGLLYRHANLIIAPSKGVLDDLVEYKNIEADKIKHIPNPIDFEVINKLASKPLQINFDISNQPIILGIGRLSYQKNHELLIKAFSKVIKMYPAKLIILGEGEDRGKLLSLIEDLRLNGKVTLPGFVSNPFAYMKEAKLFVLSSRYEGLPNAMLQVAAIDTPIVATDCPSGPKEILENGKWGALVPVDDLDAMVKAIIRGLLGEIKRVPLEIVKNTYSVEVITKQYLRVL